MRSIANCRQHWALRLHVREVCSLIVPQERCTCLSRILKHPSRDLKSSSATDPPTPQPTHSHPDHTPTTRTHLHVCWQCVHHACVVELLQQHAGGDLGGPGGQRGGAAGKRLGHTTGRQAGTRELMLTPELLCMWHMTDRHERITTEFTRRRQVRMNECLHSKHDPCLISALFEK